MKLFLVDTVSSHRLSYVVRCKSDEHAADTVVSGEATEFSQDWIGENIVRVQEIHEDDYPAIFDKDNDYLKSWPLDKKKSLVTHVKYDDETPGID